MPIQLTVFERRDNADRDALGNAALALCRAVRARDGIRSSRFYWIGADNIAILTEGEAAALDAEDTRPELDRALFALTDLARGTTSWRLLEPRAGVEAYRRAGR